MGSTRRLGEQGDGDACLGLGDCMGSFLQHVPGDGIGDTYGSLATAYTFLDPDQQSVKAV
jgi:hypothetical protein